jgi:hypothetical protein
MAAGHPRFHLHFTPTSASWMNLVPVNRSIRERKSTCTNGPRMEQESVVWTKTVDEILDTPAAYCLRISNSGH